MLKEGCVHSYWERRASRQGNRTVGLVGESLESQSRIFNERKKFIFSHCPCSLRTLDFGCGTGNFASYFGSYLGVDISESILSFAKMAYPKKRFILLKRPVPSIEAVSLFNPKLFFSVTVLQHNADELVSKIFKSMSRIDQKMTFSIYENCQVISRHVKARQPKDYLALLDENFIVLNSSSFSHYIHNEKHALTLATVLSRHKREGA